jgi:N-acetylglucosaminyldiphosphoundecaprenol N-acetyl-beta-D-mannosaminyltransferase
VRRRFPFINVSGYSPPFQPWDEMDDTDIANRIQQARPDLLLVAFGCPKAEKWMAMNYRALGVPVTIGVGATIDFLAGRMQRAPRWMQRSGVEWCYRLCQEPRRLFRRYAADLWHFSWGFLNQLRLMGGASGNEKILEASTNSWPRRPELRGFNESDWEYIQLPSRLDATTIHDGNCLWRQSVVKNAVLEMGNVKTIDSTGIALLLRVQTRFRDAGKELVLSCPSRTVERALRAMRVREFFVVKKSSDLRRERRRAALLREKVA